MTGTSRTTAFASRERPSKRVARARVTRVAKARKGAERGALLAATGQATPLALAARFGIDLHAPDFWEGSLNVIRRQIDAYEATTQA